MGDNNINHEGQPLETFELIGYGFPMKDIISGNIDKNILKQKIKETKNNIEAYKKLKLGL
jgi:hypothetical protein